MLDRGCLHSLTAAQQVAAAGVISSLAGPMRNAGRSWYQLVKR